MLTSLGEKAFLLRLKAMSCLILLLRTRQLKLITMAKLRNVNIVCNAVV